MGLQKTSCGPKNRFFRHKNCHADIGQVKYQRLLLILTFISQVVWAQTQKITGADGPQAEVPLKIRSYDEKIIVAELQEGKKINLPRKAISSSLLVNRFKTYRIPILIWI